MNKRRADNLFCLLITELQHRLEHLELVLRKARFAV